MLFQDGFENGFVQWTATGLWHQQGSAELCSFDSVPFPEGNSVAWYGSQPLCNYDVGLTFGRLQLTTWVDLPSNVGSVSLYFESRVDTEYCFALGYDTHQVTVTAQNGPDAGFTEILCTPYGPASVPTMQSPVNLSWHERRVDLSAYRGGRVRVAFEFDSVDHSANNTRGWFVDDVRIVAETGATSCPTNHAPSGCSCSTLIGWGGGCANSLGMSATLMSGGQASVGQDTLRFTAAYMPAGTAATLFRGSVELTSSAVFGDGFLCLSGSLVRLGVGFAPSGVLSWPLAGDPPLSVSSFVPPSGGVASYQVLYRDSAPGFCSSATFNLTSAQRVVWSP